MVRGQPDSWKYAPISISNGIISTFGVGSSQYAWFLRSQPKVVQAFQALWNEEDLITSLDAVGVFRGTGTPTLGGWFHTDQNAFSRRGRHTVQGLVSLWAQDQRTGGLVIIPRSHNSHTALCQRSLAAQYDHYNQYVPVPINDEVMHNYGDPVLVSSEAGDLVLWDSRAVHCNRPAVQGSDYRPVDVLPGGSVGRRLLRAVVYVCMTPRKWANQTTLINRLEAPHLQATTTHWPHDYLVTDHPMMQYIIPPPSFNLSAHQQGLL